MSTGGIIDDYLDELLLDAMPPPAPVAAPVVAADAVPAPASNEADVAVAELDPPAAVVAAALDTPADDAAPATLEAVTDTAADNTHMSPGSDDMIASIMDEFDAEFAPTPAATPVTTAQSVDMVASIMDEFDAEFGTAPAASPAAMATGSDDMVASIMDEFDAEFGATPAASPAAVAAGSSAMVSSIMDEFDAEFGATPAASPAPAAAGSSTMVASIMDEFDAEMAAASTPYIPATEDAPQPPAPTPSARAAAASVQPATTWQQIQAQAHMGRDDSHTRRANERMSRWLRLRCGTQAYALELLKVQEVVLPVPLLHLRGTAPSVLGIMNLRGQVVPVIDLGLHLGSEPIGEDAQTRIVVLEEHGEVMGLRVSAVEDVTNLSDSQIEPPDTTRICQISNDLFRGIARLAKRPMILLDATRLLQ